MTFYLWLAGAAVTGAILAALLTIALIVLYMHVRVDVTGWEFDAGLVFALFVAAPVGALLGAVWAFRSSDPPPHAEWILILLGVLVVSYLVRTFFQPGRR